MENALGPSLETPHTQVLADTSGHPAGRPHALADCIQQRDGFLLQNFCKGEDRGRPGRETKMQDSGGGNLKLSDFEFKLGSY